MRVLHVVPTISNFSAGTTDVVLSLCKAQASIGIDVQLVTLLPVSLEEKFPFM